MPHLLDVEIGQRIRSARLLRGLSQTQLGQAIDVSFQQVQKYEKGTNRVGSGCLWRIAQFLQLPIDYFYEGLELTAGASGQREALPELSVKSLRAARAIDAIEDEEVREGVLRLVKAAAKNSHG